MVRVKIIAEIGWNHLGDMSRAREMIRAAAENGADYAKFQTWQVDHLRPGPWDRDGRRELYKQAELSRDCHGELQQYCQSRGIKFLTSCFRIEDVTWLRKLMNHIKIPSTECANIPMVKEAIHLFEKVFISTGAHKPEEFMRWADYDNVYLLHCVSRYPCQPEHVNLPRIRFLASETPRFGYSGHYAGIDDAIAAVALGAQVVEKHFTTDRTLPGRDNAFSILPDQLKQLRRSVDDVARMRVDQGKGFQNVELEARSAYVGRWRG